MKAAGWYCTRFGFKHFLYQGLETGERNVVCHAVKLDKIVFVFKSALNPANKYFGEQLEKHGDHVADVAFSVNDLEAIMERAVMSGAQVVSPLTEHSDEFGRVKMATLKTYGDVSHTLIERAEYKGDFLPGYKPHYFKDPLEDAL